LPRFRQTSYSSEIVWNNSFDSNYSVFQSTLIFGLFCFSEHIDLRIILHFSLYLKWNLVWCTYIILQRTPIPLASKWSWVQS
jgi:hypothetical protein